jgi:hypothetical protein
MQVSGRFLHLDKSIDQASAPCVYRALARRSASSGQTARTPEPCSRRSLAGSIAAGSHRKRRRRTPGVPAGHWRAPLRPVRTVSGGEEPRVFPPVTGGLHCGSLSTPQTLFGPTSCSRRSAEGSIAVSRSGRALCGRARSVPAVQGRAPLRHVVCDAGHDFVHPGLLSATAGSIVPAIILRDQQLELSGPAAPWRAPLR